MIIIYSIFLLFGAIALITALIGLTQPTQFEYTATIEITGDLDKIREQVQYYSNFISWSPWSAKDPNMKQNLPENDGEIGACYTWSGNRQVGMGSMTLITVTSNQVAHALVFGKRPAAQALFSFEQVGAAYALSWTLATDMGKNPIARAFTPLMKKMIGKDFNQGLQNLKNKIEHV